MDSNNSSSMFNWEGMSSDEPVVKEEPQVANEPVAQEEPVAEPKPQPNEPQPTPESSTEPTPTPEPKPEPTVSNESWEAEKLEYERKIQELSNMQPTYANDDIRHMDEFLRNNPEETVDNFLKYQRMNLDVNLDSRKDAISVVRTELQEKNPYLSSNEIDHLMNKKYSALFDDSFTTEDSEYKEAMIDLKIDAKNAKNFLEEKKSKYQAKKADPKAIEAQKAAQEEAQKQFESIVEQNVRTYNEEPVVLGEDVELKYIVGDEEKQFIEKSIKESHNFFSSYISKDESGNPSLNVEGLRKDLLKIKAFDKAVKMAYDQGLSSGRSEVVNKLDNPTTDVDSPRTSAQKLSIMEQIAQGYAKNKK